MTSYPTRRWAAEPEAFQRQTADAEENIDLRRDLRALNTKISGLEQQLLRLADTLESTFARIDALHEMLTPPQRLSGEGESEGEESD
ncbi:pIX [Murine adenovirus 3]|uniref:PIX n=1 Tax=Murine adenovirus 3 TaxID=573199 RepID=C3SAT6_9ADEN|nr:pIX [Murine adenovirus 3]ACJ14506.1 pIX [Murine adenovirus 3]